MLNGDHLAVKKLFCPSAESPSVAAAGSRDDSVWREVENLIDVVNLI